MPFRVFLFKGTPPATVKNMEVKMKILTLIVGVLVLAFGFTSIAVAGDSASIPISITIPAIPGFNAPPYKTDTQQQAKKETRKNHPKVIVEAKGQTQTVYER